MTKDFIYRRNYITLCLNFPLRLGLQGGESGASIELLGATNSFLINNDGFEYLITLSIEIFQLTYDAATW
jgi:hypothetical protein